MYICLREKLDMVENIDIDLSSKKYQQIPADFSFIGSLPFPLINVFFHLLL